MSEKNVRCFFSHCLHWVYLLPFHRLYCKINACYWDIDVKVSCRMEVPCLANYNLTEDTRRAQLWYTHSLQCCEFKEPNQLWLSTRLSEELLQKGSGPAVVEIPTFGRVADVGCVQQQGQSFGFVDAAGDKCLFSQMPNRLIIKFKWKWNVAETSIFQIYFFPVSTLIRMHHIMSRPIWYKVIEEVEEEKNSSGENKRAFPGDHEVGLSQERMNVAQVHPHKKTESLCEVCEGNLCTDSDSVLSLGCLWVNQQNLVLKVPKYDGIAFCFPHN